MSKNQQTTKMWKEIGIEESPLYSSDYFKKQGYNSQLKGSAQNISEVLSKADQFDVLKKEDNIPEIQHISEKQIEQQVSEADKFRKMMENLNVEVIEIEENEPLQTIQEYSHVENVIQYPQPSQLKVLAKENESYNQNIGESPGSITPLLYSKSPKKIDKNVFKKQYSQLNLLKFTISECQQELKYLKNYLRDFFTIFRKIQLELQQQVQNAFIDLERHLSVKSQEQIFHLKQSYNQLKYEFQVAKGKEQINRTPVKSQFIMSDLQASQIYAKGIGDPQKINKLQHENDQLIQKIKELQAEKNNLLKEASQFKIKISGIEAKTFEVRQSNDKLYEYIFDLQQKLAYQNEEIPKISQRIRDELEQNYQKQLKVQQNEKTSLNEELKRVTEQRNQYLKKLNSIESQIAQLKIEIASKCEELQNITELYKLKNGQLKSVLENHIKQKNLFQQIIDQKDQILLNIQSLRHIKAESPLGSQIQEPQKDRYQFNGSFMKELIDVKDKDNKRYIESIEGEKIALQRENMQLKAAIQFCNKKYRPHLQPNYSQPNFTRPINSHSSQTFYSPFQETPRQSETPLILKERQLLKYEGYLQSQAKKLEEKQRAVEIDYLARRKSENNRIQKVLSNQKRYEYNPGDDDYGMRSKASKVIKTLTTIPSQRKNNFCSSQAHAIIQKVKMKHRTNNNSCSSHCDHLNNCRCDVLSRGSKTSQQSLDKNYYRMNSYRLKKRSPIRDQGQYLPHRQKSSKMKQLEEKVKKLKGQLKTSITAMKD